MSSQLVYLKPQPLLFQRAEGARDAAKTAAWAAIAKWLHSKTGSDVMPRAFGLWQPSDRGDFQTGKYDACIEIPETMQAETITGLRRQTAPGGAFRRTRYQGSCADLHSAAEAAVATLTESSELSPDLSRPLVEIYHGEHITVDQTDVKIDICVPVKLSA